MKKIVIATIATTLLTLSANAQPKKGSFMVGADLLNASAGFSTNRPGSGYSTFMLSPKVGYFLSDKFAVGANVSFSGAFSAKNFSNLMVGASPFARYYFFPKSGAQAQRLYFFLEAHAGIANATLHDKASGRKYSATSWNAGFGPGVAYFITPNISVEGSLKANYSQSLSNFNTPRSNGVFTPAATVGFQIYLGGKKKNNAQVEE